ncbi:MAG: serine/threonine protein kinase [Planctomycetota bacterium]|jgi:serine/threonine protein kinase|nr:serine/threonine protein kinase [Planctomycetota bacterium]
MVKQTSRWSDHNEPIISGSAKDNALSDKSYRMIRLLGRGTMASVYLAEQLSMARLVALKILSPTYSGDTELVKRFLREARANARLNHPHIVQAIDFGEIDNRYFLAMEYVDGESMASLIKREAPLDEKLVLTYGIQILSALEHAASHNVVHRDVKPANIMICRDGAVKLADFGLAIFADNSALADRSRRGVGTPYYMAPEQLLGGHVDWRADQCSLGVSLYEAVTGVKPFNGSTISDVLTRRLREIPIPAYRANHRVSHAFSAILAKMFTRRAEDRYQTFLDLRRDFELVMAGEKPVKTGHNTDSATRVFHRHPTTVLRKKQLFHHERRLRRSRRVFDLCLALVGGIFLMLSGYVAIHYHEISGPRSTNSNSPIAKADEDHRLEEIHAQYVERQNEWTRARILLVTALRQLDPASRRLAEDALARIKQDPSLEQTVYKRLAENAEVILASVFSLPEEQSQTVD